jgi:hypothetical protein
MMSTSFSSAEHGSEASVLRNASGARVVKRARSGWRGTLLLALLATIVVLTLARLLIGSHNWGTLFWVTLGYLLYELLFNVYLALNSLWAVTVRNRRPAAGSAGLSTPPPVSVVIAACDEEKAILPTLDAVLRQEGVQIEVFVVSNGSTDETVRTVQEVFGLEGFQKNIWRGGKR